MVANSVHLSEPVEIAEGLYWLGAKDSVSGICYNHFALSDAGQAVIISAGHSVNMLDVLEKFSPFIPVKQVTHAAFSGTVTQTGTPIKLLSEAVQTAGGKLLSLSHPRASHKISFYYGLEMNSFYHVDQNGWKLTLNSGRTLRFVYTYNLAYPGSFMIYDEKTGTLFSGELFSGYPFSWSLYAQDHYLAAMEAYHYDHIPFGRLINCAMDGLDGLKIAMIAPGHGSIINNDIGTYMKTIRNIKKDMASSPKANPPFNHELAPLEGDIQ